MDVKQGFLAILRKKIGLESVNADDENRISNELINQICDVRREMEQSRKNYEFVDDDTLIDMYIYSLKAQEMKYKHLIQKAKKAL